MEKVFKENKEKKIYKKWFKLFLICVRLLNNEFIVLILVIYFLK